MRRATLLTVCVMEFLSLGADASAQSSSRALEMEGIAGYAYFRDASGGDPGGGVAARWYVSKHLAIGPEVLYVMGPSGDRSLLVTGELTGVLPRRRVLPFARTGLGMVRRYASQWASNDLAFRVGAGVKVPVSRGFYASAEFSLGGELALKGQTQVTHRGVFAAFGYSWGSRSRTWH